LRVTKAVPNTTLVVTTSLCYTVMYVEKGAHRIVFPKKKKIQSLNGDLLVARNDD